MKYIYLLILSILLLFSFSTAYSISTTANNNNTDVYQVLESTPQYTRVKIIPAGIQVTPLEHNGTNYQRIALSGFGGSREEGKPEVPQSIKLIGISPQGSFQVNILSMIEEEFSNYLLYPAQPSPKRQADGSIQKLPFVINHDFYQLNSWYPAQPAIAQEPAILREYRVLPVAIYPVQYNPARQTIRIIKEMEIEIYQTSPRGMNEKSGSEMYDSRCDRSLYDSFILNYRHLTELTPGINGMPDMIIITHDQFYNEVIPFAEWKQQKGVATTVYRLNEIGSNPTSTQIKNFIQNLYNTATDKPDYLLLVGDVNFIPWFDMSGSMSDVPYYLLEGNDILPDISGGRISVRTDDEANIVFSKLIRYEHEPYLANPAWLQSTLIINSNEYQDPTAGFWTKAQFQNYGYNPVYHLGDNLGNATIGNVNNAVNNGVSYLYYIGHGLPTAWGTSGYSTSNIPSLTNGEKQPVISSVACNNADLDESYDVFAEVWLKNNVDKGSVGIMAFTESCSAYEPDTLARGMVRALLSDSITAFGNVIDFGRLHMYQYFGTSPDGMATMYQSLLVGEPELQVWTRIPQPLTVNSPSAAFFNIPFPVTVTNSHGPLEGVLVCYSDSSGNYARGYTDASGEVLLDPQVSTPLSGMITVTHHNYLPQQRNIEILPPQGPYILAEKFWVIDTLTNHNGIAEAGEHLYLQLSVKNIGVELAQNVTATISSPDTLLDLLVSQHSFGIIDPSLQKIEGAFEAIISVATPHLHQFPIDVAITADGGYQWQRRLFLTVRKGAQISLTPLQLNFPATFLNFTSTLALTITNDGPDTLYIQDIVSDIPQFNAGNMPAYIAPNVSIPVQINFTPDSVRLYQSVFTIRNSDPQNFNTTFTALGSGTYAPLINTSDTILYKEMTVTDSAQKVIQIFNQGLGELHFNAQVAGYNSGRGLEGTGGSDNFGHIWIDSNEPSGPAFAWVDISGSGTELPFSGSSGISEPVNLGFQFSFYGQEYNSLRICTNGWMSFTTYSVSYNNLALPNLLAPRALIAPFWDYLNFTANSHIYVENQGSKFIIQYQNIYRVMGDGPFNFQVILYANGNIILQYLNMNGTVTEATVGIQNADANDGLLVVHNDSYLEDSLAVLISKHSWLTAEPLSGTIPAQSQMDLILKFRTQNFPLGDFWASLQLESNDPAHPLYIIPVHITVSAVSGVDENLAQLPKKLQLLPNYPNPFNPTTVISWQLAVGGPVEINIYNTLGQRIRRLYSGSQPAGYHKVEWEGRNDSGSSVGTGVYLYQITTPEGELVRKMILMK
jgi:hypothetical protein